MGEGLAHTKIPPRAVVGTKTSYENGDVRLDNFEEIEAELYESAPVIRTDVETCDKAREALVTWFEKYEPEAHLADLPLHSLAVQLDGIFYPDDVPEVTGSLGVDVVAQVKPMLAEFRTIYPHAVSRFEHEFCGERATVWSSDSVASTIQDPSRYIHPEDEENVLRLYTSDEKNVHDAVTFGLRAVHGGSNYGLGITILEHHINKSGWGVFLERVTDVLQGEGASTEGLYGALVHVLYRVNTFKGASTASLERLYEYAKNDLEWMELRAYMTTRDEVLTLSRVSTSFCHQLLLEHGGPFCDEGKVREVALELFMRDADGYRGVLEEIHESLRAMWTDYEGGPDTGIVVEEMRKWRRMSRAKFVEQVPLNYLYNYVIQVSKEGALDEEFREPLFNTETERQELIASICLSPDDVRAYAQSLVTSDVRAYNEAWFETEWIQKSRQSVIPRCDRYDYFAPAQDAAREEHCADSTLGYALNCSLIHVARNTAVLYSPTGRNIGVYKEQDDATPILDSQEFADFVSMNHDLENDGENTEDEVATATMMLFWDRLPKEDQQKIEASFLMNGYDLHYFLQGVPPHASFEYAVSYCRDLAEDVRYMLPGFADALKRYAHDRLIELQEKLAYPDPIDDNEFLILMNTEYGGTDLTEEEVRDTICSLSFSATKYLQETFGIDLAGLKRREFFGLLQYLRRNKGGKGFADLRTVAEGVTDREAKLHRIRAFMSLENADGMGEHIMRIVQATKESSALADEVFATYSAMVEETQAIEENLCKQFGCQKEGKQALVHKVAQDILRDGATHLATYARELERTESREEKEEKVGRLQAQLELFRSQAHFTATTFARMKEQYPDMQIEEVAGVTSQEVHGVDMLPAQYAEMQAIYNENYKEYPDEFRAKLQVKFAERVNDGTRFHVVTEKESGSIMSFMSFTDQADGSVYFASNNTNPWLMGKRIGGAFMNTKIPSEGAGRRMCAHCVPREPITQKYLNELGFVGTGTDIVGGVELLAIVRDEEMLAGLQSKATTLSEVLAGTLPSSTYVVQEGGNTPFTFTPHEVGDVLTKMFVADEKRYVVYEKPARMSAGGEKR